MQAGDRVALFMHNAPHYLPLMWGAWWAGVAVVPINAKLHPKEAAFICTHSGSKLVCCGEDMREDLQAVLREARTQRAYLYINNRFEGSALGTLAAVPAPRLGAIAIRAALERAGVEPSAVDEVILGHVLQAAAGQGPARQAAMGAGIPKEAAAWSLNQICGSGLRAVAIGAQQIALGDARIVVAGGQESMSQAPHAQALRKGAPDLAVGQRRVEQASGVVRRDVAVHTHRTGVGVDLDFADVHAIGP